MARSSTPHPISPSPRSGEGGRRSSTSFPLSTKWSGGEGERRSGIWFPPSSQWSGGEGERRSGISFRLYRKWSGGEGERRSGISFPLSTKWRGGQGVRSFRRRLLAWYQRAARDVPWRRTRDPYRVLVSEFMLQQTQVSRVAEYYPRFLERFPDLGALARA